jgi:ribonuclease HI
MSHALEVEELPREATWVAHVDGSSMNKRSGVEVVLVNPKGQKFQYAIKLDLVTTNREVEYEAVLAVLSIAREMGVMNLEIWSDSQVVVGQVNGSFVFQGDKLIKYLEKVRQLQSYFDRVVLTKIPR